MLLEAILLSVIAASTPLLLAASGELVVERSGVLNLGVEGMMIIGAACGFAGAYLSGSTVVGALCGILAGAALAGSKAGRSQNWLPHKATSRPCVRSPSRSPGSNNRSARYPAQAAD